MAAHHPIGDSLENTGTMKTLHLLRHAKSSWDAAAMPDIERPLSKRGERAARAMGTYLKRHGIRPALILCSAALRTRQTFELLAVDDVPAEIEQGIYEASASTLLDRLRRLPDELASVMVIGHNPGMERLALTLLDEDEPGDSQAIARLRDKYPTGALATLSAPVESWQGLNSGGCRLDAFVRPADLD